MRRGVSIALGVLLALVILPLVGFRIWLAQQPNETRLAIEAFTPIEFLSVVGNQFFPQATEDRAAFGRREYPGRGHSPWVLRSSLDGRPRMLSIALAPEIWLAYSTQTAGVHQLWRGDIDFTGPVFDARHGAEPMSRGAAWWRPAAAMAWRVREAGGWEPATVHWRAHGFDPESGALWLRFEVGDRAGRRRSLVEWPERVGQSAAEVGESGEGSTDRAVRVGLERIFEVEAGEGPAVALEIDPHADSVETDGRVDSAGMLALEPGRTRFVQWFDAPDQPIDRAVASPLPRDAFAAHDCETCHHARERIVGPTWQEIAQRDAGTNHSAAAARLATRIREGSVGRWGSVAMPAHPDLTRAEATALALRILETEPENDPSTASDGATVASSSSARPSVSSTYDYDVGPRPETLHPSLRATPIEPPGFTPQVGGLAWLPDGRLAVATWDRDGAVFVVEGWDGPAEQIRIQRIAEGLHEPLGIAFADGALHVIQKQEITRLVDHDGDGWTDEYRALASDWSATSNFHEFGFGLAEIDGYLYAALSICVLEGGKSCREQTPDRGKLLRVSLATGEVEIVASGFRTPNGVAATPTGALLVTDNQGDWLPASKLVRVEPGADYGWRAPGAAADPARVTPPALWLPQNEVGNSPTQPVVLTHGPYAGQVLFGDIFNGGIKRAYLEEVDGRLQGAAFHFSGGLRAPLNRLIEAPDGSLVAGEIGSQGNWGKFGKPWYGLEVLRFAEEPAFEPMRVRLRPGGFDVVFSRPLARDLALDPGRFRVEDWYYVPSPIYGGPKYDLRRLEVQAARSSEDRHVVSIDVAGLAAGRVVYLRMDPAIRSERGEALWVDEAWYTLNALAREASAESGRADDPASDRGPDLDPDLDMDAEPNTLSEAARAAGWDLLFDGRSFAGWKNYRAESEKIEGWVVRDGALEFTRDVSFARLVLRHLNPFATPALDLMTTERFGDFELRIDWKVSPGANSGIFYVVPDESTRLSWTRALEMQVLDDARHADGQQPKRRAGDLYDIVASASRFSRPAGEWNRARIRVEGPRIEHWLNGKKVLEIVRGSGEWERALSDSKHAGVEGYGQAREGHILLQDHGDVVWYRNIKVRRLTPATCPHCRRSPSGSP